MTWLLLLPLLFNVVGGMALSAGAAENVSPGGDPSGRTVVVCTAAGMVMIDLGGAAQGDASAQMPPGGLCAFCLPLMHAGAGVAPAVAAMAAPLPVAMATPRAIPADRPAVTSVSTPNPARAPPAAA